jgi:hypothetical protein
MQVRPGRGKAEPAPGLIDQEESRDHLHSPLHRNQPDQLGVQGGEYAVDVRRAPFGSEGDGRVQRQ